jgi:hypothetical protein
VIGIPVNNDFDVLTPEIDTRSGFGYRVEFIARTLHGIASPFPYNRTGRVNVKLH